MIRKFYAGLMAIAIGLTASLSIAQAKTITVTDTLGRKVDVPASAKRILLGFYFEDFYAIGGKNAYDKVVAISKPAWRDWRYSQWQAYVAANPDIAKLVDVGEVDSGTFSIETAVSARPDVAIIAAWQYRGLGEGVAKLEASGIPVVVADYNAQTVEKHTISTIMIGKILGQENRARKLADEYANAVRDVEERVLKAGGEPKRVYIELGNKGAAEYGNSYSGHMWGGVINLAGGKNIALGKIAKWAPLNPEYVLASDPEAIFIAGSYWKNKKKAVLMGFGVKTEQTFERLSPYLSRPGWPNLTAVRDGEVHALYHGGARTLYDYTFLQYIAKVLYPEAFADIDPLKNHQRFYEAYLPIRTDGVFMIKYQK